MKIDIKKMIESSLIDWEGKIVSTLFLPSCNFRCPYCYNCDLVLYPERLANIPLEQINNYLTENKDFIDGICVSGGEPTLCFDLPLYFKEIKSKGFLVKIDTNGTNPEMLKELINYNLVDYIAMDIKSSIDIVNYSKASGVKNELLFDKVKESIDLIKNSKIDYEFRTTVVPTLHSDEIIIAIAKYISGTQKYVLQNFSSLEKTIEPSLQKIKPFSIEKIQELSNKIKKYVLNCYWR